MQIDGSKPLHVGIRRALERGIDKGIWKPGDRLPSETDLQKLTGVSRTPIRQALRNLEIAGVIFRSQGRGSFVRRSNVKNTVRRMISFAQDLRSQGYVVSTKTLIKTEVASDKHVSEQLWLKVGTMIVYLRRQFHVDDVPIAIFEHYIAPIIPIEFFQELDDFLSLYDMLGHHGYELTDATEVISATNLTPQEARILKVKQYTAAVLIDRVSCISEGQPILVTRLVGRADRFEYRLQVSSVSQVDRWRLKVDK